jgi:hypothetical protein
MYRDGRIGNAIGIGVGHFCQFTAPIWISGLPNTLRRARRA